MIVTKMALPRRTFLRGVGATLALPLLDAMVPALSAQARQVAASVRRLGFVYIPMGMNAAAWTPATEGALRAVAVAPRPDAVPRSRDGAVAARAAQRLHDRQPCVVELRVPELLQGEADRGHDYELGTTVDQIAARAIGKDTPMPSLELGTDLIAQVGNCDNGYACAYRTTCRGRRRRRRCRPRPIRAWCSSGCSATAAARSAGAPS